MGDWEDSARRRIEQIDVRKPIDLDFLCSSCSIGLIADPGSSRWLMTDFSRP